MRIRGAIIDLDGTILDSAQLWDHLPCLFLERQGIPVQKKQGQELAVRLASLSLREAIQALAAEFKIDDSVESMMHECNTLIADAYRHKLPLIAGAINGLKRLSEDGIKLCVATASDRLLAEAALARCKVLQYFAFIITEEDIGKSKRYPDIYYQAVQRLGLTIPECIIFEDADHAIKTAKEAGFTVYTSLSDYGTMQ